MIIDLEGIFLDECIVFTVVSGIYCLVKLSNKKSSPPPALIGLSTSLLLHDLSATKQ
jgi:hypothetical protein